MNSLNDAMARVAVTVNSPDGTVNVARDGDGLPTVRLKPHSLRKHDERSLATQMEQAVSGYLAGSRKAHGLAVKKVRETTRPQSPEWEAAIERRTARLRDRLAALVTDERSSDNTMRLRVHMSEGVRVKFASGALRDVSEHKLATDLSNLLRSVLREHTMRSVVVVDEFNQSESRTLEEGERER